MAFFWGYILTEVLGGCLAESIGTQPVFSYSVLLTASITLLTPMSVKLGFLYIMLCRIIFGFSLVSILYS